ACLPRQELLMRLGRGTCGRPLLSAAAGAKSREEPGHERARAASKTDHGKHGSDEPFGRTRDESEQPARSARRDAKSELAQVRAHHGFEHSERARARQFVVHRLRFVRRTYDWYSERAAFPSARVSFHVSTARDVDIGPFSTLR